VRKTAPYFHNNGAKTLEDVMRHYQAFFMIAIPVVFPGAEPLVLSDHGRRDRVLEATLAAQHLREPAIGKTRSGQSHQCNADESVSEDVIMRLDLTMPGHVSSISPAVNRVVGILAAAGCANGAEHEIEVALREALANAVTHGTKNDPSKPVRCSVVCDTMRGVLIVVQDSGEGFEPEKVPACLAAENLVSPHGRGIHLISQLGECQRLASVVRTLKYERRSSACAEYSVDGRGWC
jgi:serine/threonine-protein kinase RsbW